MIPKTISVRFDPDYEYSRRCFSKLFVFKIGNIKQATSIKDSDSNRYYAGVY